jgi:chaperone modulatory protein CbpM
MPDEPILMGTVLEEACLTVDELTGVCSVSREWVVRHVEEGVLSGSGTSSAEWRFSSRDLWRARQIHALERDFDAEPQLAALVADLLEELETLRARLRRAGLE